MNVGAENDYMVTGVEKTYPNAVHFGHAHAEAEQIGPRRRLRGPVRHCEDLVELEVLGRRAAAFSHNQVTEAEAGGGGGGGGKLCRSVYRQQVLISLALHRGGSGAEDGIGGEWY